MRRHVLIHESENCNVWMIEWPPGTGLDWHDHGGSHAQITVIEGILTNTTKSYGPELSGEYMRGGHFHVFGKTKHKIVNRQKDIALSIHVYTPPLRVVYPVELELTGLIE